MILNYIKFAIRNLRKNFFFSTINIIGLAIGIAASMLIMLYVIDELSYDKFHKNHENMYRVNLRGAISGQQVDAAATCAPMAEVLRDEFPEIASSVRIAQWEEVPVTYGENAFTEQNVILADSNFFSFFSFDLLTGNPQEVFSEPNKVVITESTARKYFGTEPNDDSPIGEIMEIGTSRFPCMVVGIIKDSPSNSHFRFDMIMSLMTWEAARSDRWINNFLYTYIRLHEGTEPEQVESKFVDLVIKYVGPEAEEALGMDISSFAESDTADFYYGYYLMPVTDIHLYSKLTAELSPGGDIQFVYIFSAIAIFILVIAIINFINLATAQAGRRAREVGIRKTAGAVSSELVPQFLTESIVQALIAMIIAGALIHFAITPFNDIAQKAVTFNALEQTWISPVLILMAIIIGLLAGIYPAFYLTSFRPANVLRGNTGSATGTSMIRNTLVIFQFFISTVLIISTLVIYRQMNFVQGQNLGFDKESILVIENGGSLGDNRSAFRNKLVTYDFIDAASYSSDMPPRVMSSSVFRPMGGDGRDHLLNFYWADQDYQDVMGFEMAAGRFYSRDFPSDSMSIVVNEAAIRQFGWDTWEGKKVLSFNQGPEGRTVDVIGVMEDFHYNSLREEIQPMAILPAQWGNLLVLKMNTDDFSSAIETLRKEWAGVSDGAPFDYYFLDDKFDTVYRSEQRMGTVILIFSCLAIFVACLGLFGLATFTAERRTHEMGIRKVLGATTWSIITLLNRDFLRLILVSILISVPVAWYTMDLWLQSFAYRTNLGFQVFLLAAGIATLLAVVTVSFKAFSAARKDPVQSIKIQ